MHEDNGAASEAIAAMLQAVAEATMRLHRELDAVESDLARVVEMLVQATGRSDLALDFLHCLGNPRSTLH